MRPHRLCSCSAALALPSSKSSSNSSHRLPALALAKFHSPSMSGRSQFRGAGRRGGSGRNRGGGGGRGGGGRGEQRWWDPVWRAERLRQMQGEVLCFRFYPAIALYESSCTNNVGRYKY